MAKFFSFLPGHFHLAQAGRSKKRRGAKYGQNGEEEKTMGLYKKTKKRENCICERSLRDKRKKKYDKAMSFLGDIPLERLTDAYRQCVHSREFDGIDPRKLLRNDEMKE